MVRYILVDSGVPSSMWGELLMAAAYLRNRTLHKAVKMEKPFKMLHDEKVDLSPLRVVGARTFVHVNDSRKLVAAAWEGKVCGYSEESKSYRVWNAKTRRVVESRNVTLSRHRRPSYPACKALSVARSGTAVIESRPRHFGQRLHIVRPLTAGCNGLHRRCSGLHHQHSR